MEDKQPQVKETKISKFQTILAITYWISVAVMFIGIIFFRTGISLFIAIVIEFMIILCVEPIYEYIKGISRNHRGIKFESVARLGYAVILEICLIIVLYKVIFSKAIAEDNNYEVYNFIAAFIIISFAAMLISLTIVRTRTLVNEKRGFLQYIGSIIFGILMILNFIILPIYKFCTPIKTIDFINVKRTEEFTILKITEDKSPGINIKVSTLGGIDDIRFSDMLYNEISKIKAENVRNLDKINYELRGLKEDSYFALFPEYKETFNKIRSAGGIDAGYIYEIRVYEDGMIILHDLRDINLPPFFYKPVEYYRVNLSGELLGEIKSVIEEKQRELNK